MTEQLASTNPVLNAEFRYQRFVIQNSRSGVVWIILAVLMVVPAFLVALIFTGGLLLDWLNPPIWYAIPASWYSGASLMLLIVAVSLYIVVTLVTMALAHGSIRREKDKFTWGLLRLTEVKSEQIVLGKWWASLQALNGDNVAVIFLRVGLLAMVCGIYIPAWHQTLNITAPYRLYFLVLLPVIFFQAALDAAFSAILGIASAVPDETLGQVTSYTASIVRLFLSIAMGWWLWEVFYRLSYSFAESLILALIGFFVTLICLLLGLIAAKLLVDRS